MTTPDDATTRVLRSLDAADAELSEQQRGRAAVTLERILATDLATPTPTPRPARRPWRLVVLAGGAAAAVVTALVVLPTTIGGDEAFASWSATPVELRGEERSAALDACLVLQGNDDGELALDPAAGGSAVVAESRGGWDYVAFTAVGPSGRELSGSCLMPDALVAEPRPGEGGFFGGLGGADEMAGTRPRPDVVHEDIYGVGSVGGDRFVYAEGRAGADVVGIEVTTPGGLGVEASLENGRWAVWWPATDADLRDGPTYEATLRDGSVSDTQPR